MSTTKSEELKTLSQRMPNFGYNVQNSDTGVSIFKVGRDVSVKEIKGCIKELFGAGYTKLFILEERQARYNFLHVTDQTS